MKKSTSSLQVLFFLHNFSSIRQFFFLFSFLMQEVLF